jgi:hypothetical protein
VGPPATCSSTPPKSFSDPTFVWGFQKMGSLAHNGRFVSHVPRALGRDRTQARPTNIGGDWNRLFRVGRTAGSDFSRKKKKRRGKNKKEREKKNRVTEATGIGLFVFLFPRSTWPSARAITGTIDYFPTRENKKNKMRRWERSER